MLRRLRKEARTSHALPFLLLAGCVSSPPGALLETKSGHVDLSQSLSSRVCIATLRLKPKDDVRGQLKTFALDQKIEAASIISAVGSVEQAELRFANQDRYTTIRGPLEVVSLSGLFSVHGEHVHASLADAKGKVIGGHLGEQTLVYTTLELVIAIYPELSFKRSPDPSTTFKELFVERITTAYSESNLCP